MAGRQGFNFRAQNFSEKNPQGLYVNPYVGGRRHLCGYRDEICRPAFNFIIRHREQLLEFKSKNCIALVTTCNILLYRLLISPTAHNLL